MQSHYKEVLYDAASQGFFYENKKEYFEVPFLYSSFQAAEMCI